jgi:hypothetical protein
LIEDEEADDQIEDEPIEEDAEETENVCKFFFPFSKI